MNYVQFGRGGLYVSRLAFGTWKIEQANRDHVEPMLHRALDAGVNLIDTSRGYGGGEAEALVGRIVRQRGERERLLVATKCSAPHPREPNGFMTTRRSIVQHCERSLKQLGLDYIDLYQLHCAERFVPIDETLNAMTDLVRQGKIRYAGTSNYKGWQLVEACWAAEKHHYVKFASDQSEYHLFDRRLERENFPAMQTYGMAALVYSPLKRGLLSCKRYRGPGAAVDPDVEAAYRANPDGFTFSEPVQTALGKLVALSRASGFSPARLALAFVMQHPVTAIPIIGPRTPEQLEDCLGADEVLVDDEMRRALDAIVAPGEALCGQGFNPYNHGPTARWY